MFSRTNRFAPFSSLFTMLLGATLATWGVGCLAPAGSDELQTESALTAAKEETPAKSQAPAQSQDDAGTSAKEDPANGGTASGDTTRSEGNVLGGGGGEATSPPAYNGHPTANKQ